MWIWCEFEWTSSGFANSSGAVSAVVDGVRELTGAVMRSACIVLDNRNIPNEFSSFKKKQRFFPAIVSHVIRLNQTPIVPRTSYQVNLKYATMKTNKLKTTWNERVGSTTAASMPGKRSSPAPTTIKTGGCLIFIVFGIRTFSKRDGTARCVSPHANAEYFSLDTFHVPERPQPNRFNQQRRRRKHSDIGLMRQYSGGWFSNGYKCLWFFAVAVVASNPLFSRRKTHCRDANIMRILSVCLGFAYLQCVRNFTNNNRKNHQQQQRLPIRWWCEWWNADTGRSACGANEQRQMRSPQIFFKAAGDAAGFVCCSVPFHISACSFRLRFTVWIDYLLSFSLNSQAEKWDSLIKIVPQIHRNQFIIQNHRSSVNKFIIFFLRPKTAKIPFKTKKVVECSIGIGRVRWAWMNGGPFAHFFRSIFFSLPFRSLLLASLWSLMCVARNFKHTIASDSDTDWDCTANGIESLSQTTHTTTISRETQKINKNIYVEVTHYLLHFSHHLAPHTKKMRSAQCQCWMVEGEWSGCVEGNVANDSFTSICATFSANINI